MDFKYVEGDYSKLGVSESTKGWTFTFEGEKEDKCSIVLVDIATGEETILDIPSEYCIGSLRSVLVEDFNPEKYAYYYLINDERTIDPYATAIYGREKWADYDRLPDKAEVLCKQLKSSFNWGDDARPELKADELAIYKLHVRGFSMDTKKKNAGTFAAVTASIPYIKSLGFTAIELMPVYEFEELSLHSAAGKLPDYIKWESMPEDKIKPKDEAIDKKLNYWGYGEGNYFATKSSYASNPNKASDEFKELVKTLHANNMECIMEMHFNSDVNHNLILRALRHWLREYHVDGFRLMGEKLPITSIMQHAMLSRTKIFYSDFDENLIPNKRQNDTLFVDREDYLYPSRKLLNHINGDMREFVNQQRKQGQTLGYINYIASNNGFSLADVFMYNDKHNDDNGENNTDGNNWNFSNNYGCEGPSKKKLISKTRELKWRNALAMLFMGQGVPMLMAGDEVCNSQAGNNNAYCQDNEIGWVNWKSKAAAARYTDYVSKLMAFRQEHKIISSGKPYKFNDYKAFGYPDVSYHGENAWISESDMDKLAIGVMYGGAYAKELGSENDDFVYVAYNFYSNREKLALPKLPKGKNWYVVMDTTAKDPFLGEPLLCEETQISMEPSAICILVGK